MLINRLKQFFHLFDARYEDLLAGNVALNGLRDVTAGLVVAAVAIPLGMGIAMASGLRPEQGIVPGAIAVLLGSLFGGSKYQVYGPTAAFIPIIGAIMAEHDQGFLVLCSLIAGFILWCLGVTGMGRIVKQVPHSIIVGFTIGIAVSIAVTQGTEVLGVQATAEGHGAWPKLQAMLEHFGHLNLWAVVLAVGSVLFIKLLLRVSVFIPAPLLAIAAAIGLSQTWLADANLDLVVTKYGAISAKSLQFAAPSLESLDISMFGDIAYYAIAIVFVAAIESLLCAHLADRLAGNRGTPFNADKELWGQGHLMVLVPLLNGFPSTGALARTATNIKLGAVSPLSGVFNFVFQLLLAYYVAHYLELVPMACIAGILLYVAMNMVKREEVEEVLSMGHGHTALMLYTAAAVVATDFLRGVLSALAIYLVWRFVEHSRARIAETELEVPSLSTALRASIEEAKQRPRAVVNGHHAHGVERRKWLAHIRQPALMARSAFVHHQASVIGRVVLGDSVHIAAGASVRADEGSPFYIGANTNIQDGVVIHALQDRYVMVGGGSWAVYIGKNVSIAHDALVHGPSYVGDETFIGFKAVVHDAVVGEGCFIGIGAIVAGVELPAGRFVPPGAVIDSQAKADALGPVRPEHREFNADVVEVNRGLAAAYHEHNGHGHGLALGKSGHGPVPAFAADWAPIAGTGGVF
ncbi:SulP family inorganic anion transporter [Methylogaea oryzae]|uniref:SLC26A/SulP transporter domain-containing protein n=3 Tax=Methylogaea oryzae TaxID=1295382 RepID=A0A8D4VT84_9GAMM|nr:SulP family inorganic anion transporter [Methylogaea oryzae]BBL72864.1 hypothetical protein MoryE10_34700 [Methylogaea oryzae]